jgi:hypothetical protein
MFKLFTISVVDSRSGELSFNLSAFFFSGRKFFNLLDRELIFLTPLLSIRDSLLGFVYGIRKLCF